MGVVKILIPSLKLLGKLAALSPKYLYSKSAGIRAFKRQLREQGLDNSHIKALSKQYKNLISIRKMAFTAHYQYQKN